MSIRNDASDCGIPDYMIGGIERYIEHGIPPGDFLSAIITNDLREAVGRADECNVHLLRNYVQFFYNYTPSPCWGSVEKMNSWIDRFNFSIADAAVKPC